MARNNSPDIDWAPLHDTVVEMLKQNYTFSSIGYAVGQTGNAVRLYANRMKLRGLKPPTRSIAERHKAKRLPEVAPEKPNRVHLRGAASIPKAAKRGRNPRKDIGNWRVPVAVTDLDAAVQELRKTHSPVCCEDTIKYPSRTPEGYKPTTRFRVGALRDVSAERVLEMAQERAAA